MMEAPEEEGGLLGEDHGWGIFVVDERVILGAMHEGEGGGGVLVELAAGRHDGGCVCCYVCSLCGLLSVLTSEGGLFQCDLGGVWAQISIHPNGAR
jgi:hypothetical protein